jgi:broad specificity phosphatase PhoE
MKMSMKLPKREFFFLRHGETEYNRTGRFQGQIDVPLNSAGMAQAEAVVNHLVERKITRIVSSPAQRVLQTIKPLLAASDIPLHVDYDLMEMSVGSFEGREIATVRQEHGLGPQDSWVPVLPEDAEVWDEFSFRVSSAVSRLTRKYSGETVLVASHGLVFHALTAALTGQKIYSANAEPHVFKPSTDGWAVAPVSSWPTQEDTIVRST